MIKPIIKIESADEEIKALKAELERVTAERDKAMKKPKLAYIIKDVTDVICPACGYVFFRCYKPQGLSWNETQKRHKYCENCGQAIDWNDDRETEESKC